MQFHLNGFQPGDPSVSPADATAGKPDAGKLPAQVDVLIVGCGPAGLTLAAQLAAFPDIKTCIVEQMDGPLQRGRADGVACRSMEMFNAFGFADKLLKEAYWVNETTFWKPDETTPANITRHGRIQDVEDGLSEFPHVILNQARVHDFYLEVMRNSATRLEPFYSRQLTTLQSDTASEVSQASYPVTATFKATGESERVEIVRAKYVAGCDGARSVVRESIGLKLQGDSANQAWGVMDVLMVTDFPDIRMKSLIQSAKEGSIIIIPREGGYLVRLYIELAKLDADERVADRNITPKQLIDKACAIFHPFKIEVKEIAWWSVYEIGQRLCDRFDDVPDEQRSKLSPRVFIAGDACHTHSPKAGQGMNVSMRDAFNLGWKLASVLRQQCKPELLHTYTEERQNIAKTLIDFDREWSKIIGSRPKVSDDSSTEGLEPTEFQKYFVRHGRYTAGTAIQYPSSVVTAPTAIANTVAAPITTTTTIPTTTVPTLTAEAGYQHLATGFDTGMRFHSAPVIRLSDAKPMHLGHVLKADGRWRLFVFSDASDPADTSAPVHRLCETLMDSPESPLHRYDLHPYKSQRDQSGNGEVSNTESPVFQTPSIQTPSIQSTGIQSTGSEASADIDSFIDVRAVYQQYFRDIELSTLPALLLPAKGKHGLFDYEKVFCANRTRGEDIFEVRGINRQQGCMVLVRPDQHIALVLPLDAAAELSAFFDQFMIIHQ